MTEIEFPPNVDDRAMLGPLNSSALRSSPSYRRHITRADPLMFALVYLTGDRDDGRPNHLASKQTGHKISFSRMHVNMYAGARRWAADEPIREGWIAPRGAAKALALDTPVLTADRGWTTHGELCVDDRVFDETGTPCRVTWTSSRWLGRPCYRITFSGGEQIVADADHEWPVHDRYRTAPGEQTTAEIARKWLLSDRRGFSEHRYSIAACAPLSYPDADLPVDPYVLGAWLGDGDTAGGRITVDRADADHLMGQLRKRGEVPRLTHYPSSSALTISVGRPRPERCGREHIWEVGDDQRRRPCRLCVGQHQRVHYGTGMLAPRTNVPLTVRLARAGVRDHKHVPTAYLTASPGQRMELLRGLMDTDGSASLRGECTFSNTNARLASDVMALALSLGLRATLTEGDATLSGRRIGPHYRVRFRTTDDVFTLPRKLDRLRPGQRSRRQIVHVERVEDATTSCISVDSPSHLYLVGRHLIPTHNSTTNFLSLPLWALAHGHRNYVMAFADAAGQAEAHLATLRQELERNTLLRQDYPELWPGRGSGARNTATDILFAGGSAMSARGMDSRSLGAKSGADRPDLIIGDDMEPPGSVYSPEQKAKRLDTLINAILPMNDLAVVQLVGTVTMYGSIMHDLVLAALGEHTADWIASEEFTPRYYAPIRRRRDGVEESCWPARWSLDELHRRRDAGGAPGGSVTWRLNFLNQPARIGEDGVGWIPSLFRYQTPPITRPVMFVDIATTSKASSDQSAVAVMATTRDGRKVVIDSCRGYRVTPAALRDEVHRLVRARDIRDVHVEVNQGGDAWTSILSPMPDGAKLHPHISRSHKPTRIMDLLDQYERGNVLHARKLAELETQMLDHHPKAKHDDLLDVISIGVGKLLEGSVRL